MKKNKKIKKNATSVIFFTILLQLMLSIRLLQPIVDGKKNNYSDISKYKTKSSLKFRICYKKYCECCTSKKNINNKIGRAHV